MRIPRWAVCAMLVLPWLAGCKNGRDTTPPAVSGPPPTAGEMPFQVTPVATFEEPWAMVFLPDGRLLVTEKRGAIRLLGADGRVGSIRGVPEVAYGGQGGLGDIILHPRFADSQQVYLSWAEAGDGDVRGAVVARARLVLDGDGGQLEDLEVIWRQSPKVGGNGHYGHRLAFSPDGKYLFVTSGERQKFEPAQDLSTNLGKVLRLDEHGGVPADNPFASRGGLSAQIWSYGHRNPLGIAFDAAGRLWVHEMGPRGGDELNLIRRGANYGYPSVSDGDHYDGRPIPDHRTRPEFEAPVISWTPVISPAGFLIYTGELFPAWRGSGFLGGLSSRALIRVAFAGDAAREAERWDMRQRIREVEQGPEGAIYLLEDGRAGTGGRLLRLTPAG